AISRDGPRTSILWCSSLQRPPRSSLLPYTTLFRSVHALLKEQADAPVFVPPQGHSDGARTDDALLPEDRLHGGPGETRQVGTPRSEEHTSELQSRENLVCRLLLEKKNTQRPTRYDH